VLIWQAKAGEEQRPSNLQNLRKMHMLSKKQIQSCLPRDVPVAPRTFLGRQECNGYISMIMNHNPEDGGSTAFETLVTNHHITRRNNPENHDFSSVKTSNYE
jgi:hypothetical protein